MVITCFTRVVSVVLIRISRIRNRSPFHEIALYMLFFPCVFHEKNVVFLRFRLLYLFSTMCYGTLRRSDLEPIVKPSHKRTSKVRGNRWTIFIKLVQVFLPE